MKNINTKDSTNLKDRPSLILGNIKSKNHKYLIIGIIFASFIILFILVLIYLFFIYNKDSGDVYKLVNDAYKRGDCKSVIDESNKYFNKVNKQDTYLSLIADESYYCATKNNDWASVKLYVDKVILYSEGAVKQQWQDRQHSIEYILYQEQFKQQKDDNSSTQESKYDGPIL